MRLDDFPRDTRFNARLKASEPLTPAGADAEIHHLVLEIADPGFVFDIGQIGRAHV